MNNRVGKRVVVIKSSLVQLIFNFEIHHVFLFAERN